MATPDFILALREKIGHMPLWLTGVTAVVTRGSGSDLEVLLVTRADTGAITPVTGIVDPGEHPATAAARETLEEAGVRARPVRLAGVGVTDPMTYPNGDHSQYIDLIFRLDYLDGDPWPADGENTAAGWHRLDALPDMTEEMRKRIETAIEDSPAAAFEFSEPWA
jgi:8-oxo-dGTP pyrophosphatase MutT (NUDIX family)